MIVNVIFSLYIGLLAVADGGHRDAQHDAERHHPDGVDLRPVRRPVRHERRLRLQQSGAGQVDRPATTPHFRLQFGTLGLDPSLRTTSDAFRFASSVERLPLHLPATEADPAPIGLRTERGARRPTPKFIPDPS